MPRENSAKVGVAYVRVSTDEQALGPEAQRAAIEAWASREGIHIAAWHADDGVSGAAPVAKRPALLGALESVKACGAGVLVMHKRDRLARDVAAAKTIETLSTKAGARVRTTDGTSDAKGSARVIQAGIHDLFAEYERAVIRERTTAALSVKKTKGERVGTVPYGYRVADDGVRLEADETEQEVISTARSLQADGRSLRAIVAELAARGVVGRAGKPLALTSVANMLRRAVQSTV